MRVGVAGPIEIDLLKQHLYQDYHRTADRINGLGGTQVTQLVREYLSLGLKVTVYTLDRNVPEGQGVDLFGTDLTVFVGPFRSGRRRIFDFQAVERRALIRFMLDNPPDIIHAHWTYEFAQAAINSGFPHVITVRDWAPAILRLMPKPYRVMRLMMNHKTLKQASSLTANSPYIAKKLLRFYNLDVPVVPNGIMDDQLYDQPKQLRKESRLIVSVSNGFGKLKNITSLIKAHAIYNERSDVKACLRLVGLGMEEGGPANRWAIEHGLDSDCVYYLGALPRDEVMQEFIEADLMVHPALEESFGNTLIEAMACKVPVIAGAESGAVPWVLNYGGAGKLVDVTSPDKIALAIGGILNDDATWSYYSSAGFAHTRESFGMDMVASRYVEILREAKDK